MYWHRINVTEEDDGRLFAGRAAEHDGVADPLRAGLSREPLGERTLLSNGAAHVTQLPGQLGELVAQLAQTGTPKSRSAWFSEVFLSVLSPRLPMISEHGVKYSPAGNLRGRIPGMTTLRAGTRPLRTRSSAEVTS